MYIQKVYKNGNSIAVTVPKTFAREIGIRDGSSVVIEKARGKITIFPNKKKKVIGGVTVGFMKMVDHFAREHEDVLGELAKSSEHSELTEFKKWLNDISRNEEKLIKLLAKGYVEAKKNSKKIK